MIYKIINSRKFRFRRAVFVYLLIISYLTTFNSCMTTENISITLDSLDSSSVHEISMIKLNDGTKIECQGKIIKIKKESDSTLLFDISSYTVGDNFKTYWTNKQISSGDIFKIQLEKPVLNTGVTVGIAVISAAILSFLIAMGISMKTL